MQAAPREESRILNRLRPPMRQEYANIGERPYSITFQRADRWRIFVPDQGSFHVGLVEIVLATGTHIKLDSLDTRMRSVLHRQGNNIEDFIHLGRSFMIRFERPINAFGHTGVACIRFSACNMTSSQALWDARRPRA